MRQFDSQRAANRSRSASGRVILVSTPGCEAKRLWATEPYAKRHDLLAPSDDHPSVLRPVFELSIWLATTLARRRSLEVQIGV